jgi:hypothetical protein
MAGSTWRGFFKRTQRESDQEHPSGRPDARSSRERGAEVAFESLEYEDGQPFIALVFLRNGVPIEPSGRVFTLELVPGTPKLEADTLASLLNRRVTHLLETHVPVELDRSAELDADLHGSEREGGPP